MNNDVNNQFAHSSEDVSHKQESNNVFLGEPRKVAAGNCIKWIKDGWQLFIGQKGMWILAILLYSVMYFVIHIILNLIAIPVISSGFILLIKPIFMAGFMLACHKQHDNGHFDIANIFAGFKKNLPQLLMLGIFPLILCAILFFSFHDLLFKIRTGMTMAIMQGSLSHFQMPFISTGLKITLAIVWIIGTIYSLAILLAPSLIMINDMNAIHAMKQSFKAFSKNLLAIVLYILIMFAIVSVCFFAFVVAFLLLKSISLIMVIICSPIFIIFYFCFVSIFISTKYSIYRDIFYKEA